MAISDLLLGPALRWEALLQLFEVTAAGIALFLLYLSYTPRVSKDSPAFISDKVLFLGSTDFFKKNWRFWKPCVEKSKTGNFSFWAGKKHIVGLSGEAARKMYLDSPSLDFKAATDLLAVGPDRLPLHQIHAPGYHNGRSYFQRHVLDLQKSEHLAKRLPEVVRDARLFVDALERRPEGMIRPFPYCYSLLAAQGCRIAGCHEIADDSALLQDLSHYLTILFANPGAHCAARPWLPSITSMRRRYGRWGVGRLVGPLIDRRIKSRSTRPDDALQALLDNGDSKDHIVNYLIPLLFIIGANAIATTCVLLINIANNPVWQERIYQEIKDAVKAHSKDQDAPLLDQLESLPLNAWETSFPTVGYCLKEAIRLWVSFPMMRQNVSDADVAIPGTGEVIPPGSFASYYTSEVHFDERLYPNARRFDPERYAEGREEFKKEAYSYLGWGAGRTPCIGMRWAKLQEVINLVHFVAKYKWQVTEPLTNENMEIMAVPDYHIPLAIGCKYELREKA